MKNLILSLAFVSGLALNATPISIHSLNEVVHFENEKLVDIEVNTFCKLITKGDLEAVKSMIAAGTDVDQKSVGMTPLMYAARYNKGEIVKVLIAEGANLKIKSNRGYTALEYAEMSKAKDAYKIISDHLYTKMKKKKRSI